jgi:hypothetical protein
MSRAETMKARAAAFSNPEVGLNIAELAEMLGFVSAKAIKRMEDATFVYYPDKGLVPYKRLGKLADVRGIARKKNQRGQELNLVYLVDACAFAAWFSEWSGLPLPENFLEEADTVGAALGVLVALMDDE